MIFSRKELPTMVPDWFQHNSSDRTLTLAGIVGEVIDDVQSVPGVVRDFSGKSVSVSGPHHPSFMPTYIHKIN